MLWCLEFFEEEKNFESNFPKFLIIHRIYKNKINIKNTYMYIYYNELLTDQVK